MKLELSSLHYVLMVIGAILGTKLGIRGIAVFSFILSMITVLIIVPIFIGQMVQGFISMLFNVNIPDFILIGIVIILTLMVFREIGRSLLFALDPTALPSIENRILGLCLGASLGFFAAEYLF